MALTSVATSLRQALNRATTNSVATMLASILFGDVVRALTTRLYGKAPAANAYNATSQHVIVLPDDAKATAILRAYARSGSGTPGELTITAPGTTAAASHITVSPSGDIAFASADAWTAVDVVYEPEKVDVVEVTLPVSSNTLTLPTQLGKAVVLMEVESIVGTLVSKLVVDNPGTSVATGHAALSASKAAVAFASDDAVTSARVKYGVYPRIDINDQLEATSDFI